MLRELAWILATYPDARLRDGNEAVGLAQKAYVLSGPEDPIALRVLAAAYAEAGRFSEAVRITEDLLSICESNPEMAKNIDFFRSRLELYQSNQPYHQDLTGVAFSETQPSPGSEQLIDLAADPKLVDDDELRPRILDLVDTMPHQVLP